MTGCPVLPWPRWGEGDGQMMEQQLPGAFLGLSWGRRGFSRGQRFSWQAGVDEMTSRMMRKAE